MLILVVNPCKEDPTFSSEFTVQLPRILVYCYLHRPTTNVSSVTHFNSAISASVMQRVKDYHEKKERQQRVNRTIIKHWGLAVFERVFEGAYSNTTLEYIVSVANRCEAWETAACYLLYAFHHKIKERTRHQRKSDELQTIDVKNTLTYYANRNTSEGIRLLNGVQIIEIDSVRQLADRLLPPSPDDPETS